MKILFLWWLLVGHGPKPPARPPVSVRIVKASPTFNTSSTIKLELRNNTKAAISYAAQLEVKNTAKRLGGVNPPAWYVADGNMETPDDRQQTASSRCQIIAAGKSKIINYKLSDTKLFSLFKRDYSTNGRIVFRVEFAPCSGKNSVLSPWFTMGM